MGDELYSDFVSKEVDKVELIYTKFVSLISSEPIVQTLLPLTPAVSLPLCSSLPTLGAWPHSMCVVVDVTVVIMLSEL